MNCKLITVLLALVLITFCGGIASALSVPDVKSSSFLTIEQKTEILGLMAAGNATEAESRYSSYFAKAELDKMQAEAKAAADEIEAERVAKLQKSWNKALSPLTIEQCWTWALSQTDSTLSNTDGQKLVDYMAARYGLTDKVKNVAGTPSVRLLALQEAYQARSEFNTSVDARVRRNTTLLKTSLRQVMSQVAHQDSIIADLTTRVDTTNIRLDDIETRLSDDEFDMANAMREMANQAKFKDDDVRPAIRSAADDIAARSSKSK